MHCYFTGDDGEESIVFKHIDSPPAFACETCGTTLIRGHFADDPGDETA